MTSARPAQTPNLFNKIQHCSVNEFENEEKINSYLKSEIPGFAVKHCLWQLQQRLYEVFLTLVLLQQSFQLFFSKTWRKLSHK